MAGQDNSVTMYSKSGKTLQIQNDPAAIAEATSKGWLKAQPLPTQTAPSKGDAAGAPPEYMGFTPSNIARNIWQGGKEMFQGALEFGKQGAMATMPGGPELMRMLGKQDPRMALLHSVTDPMKQEMYKGAADPNVVSRFGHGLAGSIPMVGPWAGQLGEQAGRGDIGGALAKGGTQYGLGELAGAAAGRFAPEARFARQVKGEEAGLKATTEIGRAPGTKPGMEAAKVVTQPLRDVMNTQLESFDKFMAQQHVNLQGLERYTMRARTLIGDIERSPQMKQIDVSAAKDVVNRLDQRLASGQPMTWPEARTYLSEIRNAQGGLKGASMLRTALGNLEENVSAAVSSSAERSGVGSQWKAYEKNYHQLSAMERGYSKIVTSKSPKQMEAVASKRDPLVTVKGVGIGGGTGAGRIAKGELKGFTQGMKALERNIHAVQVPGAQGPAMAPPMPPQGPPGGGPPQLGPGGSSGPFQQPPAPPQGGMGGAVPGSQPELGPATSTQMGPSTLAHGPMEKGVVEAMQQWQRTNPPGAAREASPVKGGEGHTSAGGEISSEETAPGRGVHAIIDNRTGAPTYHGKKFAPDAVHGDQVHVSIMPDGSYRINEGVISPSTTANIKKYVKALLGKKATNIRQIY